ncbi:hypothetical protein SLS58_002875 [Diplodia intermedia]|uniref:Ubiquitin-like protease family profile domain-containing protein n=1 Tax=Diplodia intermedia TaxID=856260 RepID=A0ABR3TYN1_9PEZI
MNYASQGDRARGNTMRFSTKRKKRYSRAISKARVKPDTHVPNIRIKLQNGSFIAKGIGKGSKFNKWIRTSSEYITYNTTEYHVGDIVVVNVADEQLATRIELAVIAACRGMDLHLVWLFRTDTTPERKTLVGPDVASAYKLILSVYSDIASVECLVGHMPPCERKSVCVDWVLQLEPAKAICISTPRNGCFMRSLVERIKARELMDKTFPAPSGPLNSTPSQQDNGVPPEGEERMPAWRGHHITLSPAPPEFAVSKRPMDDTQAAAALTTKKQKTDTLPDRSRATRKVVPPECNSTLTAVESPPHDTTLLVEPESHPAHLKSPREPEHHHPSHDISDPMFQTDPDLLGSTEGFGTVDDAASTAHPVVGASEAPVSESDEQRVLANAVPALEGHNWLGEETIMPLIRLFMPNTGVRLVDIGEVPEQAWEAWGTSRSKSVDLRAWDDIVLVPLFAPELQHWRLLSYSIVSGAIVVTVYDSLKAECDLDSMEPAVRAIAKFLGYDLERPLRIEGADKASIAQCMRLEAVTIDVNSIQALQQNDRHNCGVLVVIHAIYIIARADLPQASSGNLWRFILRCCLQKECTQEEFAAEFSATPPVHTVQPRRPGYHLLDCHATTHSRCERLRQAALQAEEFCKVVHMIQHRVNEEMERLAFLNRLDEIGSRLSAMERARLSLAFGNDSRCLEKMRGRSGMGRSESLVGLAQVALDIRVWIGAEFQRSKQALDRVTEEVRVAMVDADEWVKQARQRIKDAGQVQEGAKTDMDDAD